MILRLFSNYANLMLLLSDRKRDCYVVRMGLWSIYYDSPKILDGQAYCLVCENQN